MMVYVKNSYTYTSGGVTLTRAGNTYYTYKLLPEVKDGQGNTTTPAEVRNSTTGAMPNAEANWTAVGLTGAAGTQGQQGAPGADYASCRSAVHGIGEPGGRC
jgi:hypothetical protein